MGEIGAFGASDKLALELAECSGARAFSLILRLCMVCAYGLGMLAALAAERRGPYYYRRTRANALALVKKTARLCKRAGSLRT